MGTEIDEGNEAGRACVVIIVFVITIISIVSGIIYYINLYGGVVILAIAIGAILICFSSMASDTSESEDGFKTSKSHASCPACEDNFAYTYKSKDAFGRLTCPTCGKTFKPGKYSSSVASTSSQKLELPRGVPHPLAANCRESEVAASLANTRISFSITRKAARDIITSLGSTNELETLILIGLDYLSANRIAAALACFYEAELIDYYHEKLVRLRVRFNRPSQSFNDIAEEYFSRT